jgi:transcriptional regulator with XRE-family HTH domain
MRHGPIARQAYVYARLSPADILGENSGMERTNAHWNRAVGQAIKRAREAKAWNQTELGSRIDMTQGDVSKIESGKRGLSFETLASVAKALGTTASAILASAEGVAVPTPVPAASERVDAEKRFDRLEGDIDSIRLFLVHALRVFSVRTPGVAGELEQVLRDAATPEYSERGSQALMLEVLREVREAEEAAPPAVPPRAKAGSSRRTA